MAFGTGHATTTTQAVYIPDLWSKTVQMANEANLVFGKLVTRFDGEVKYGDSLKIPSAGNYTAQTKSASTIVTWANTATDGSTTINIDTHAYVAFLIEDILKTQSGMYDIESIFKRKGGYGISKKIDGDLAALVASATQTVGDFSSDKVEDAHITRAIQYLDDADADPDDRHFVFKPVVATSIRGIDKFIRMDSTGEKRVTKGEIGDIYGLKLHQSTNVYNVGDEDYNVIFQKEAFALAIQKNMTTETGRILEYMSDGVIVSTLYGKAEYRSTSYVLVKS